MSKTGGVLSTFLFAIYIESLVKKVTGMNLGCRLGLQNSSILLYADDIVLLAPSRWALQSLLNKASIEAQALSFTFNNTKSKYMIFTFKSCKSTAPGKVMINSAPLELVSSFKYLGFIVNENMNNVDDICRVRNKFYSDFNCLLRKFHFVFILKILLKLLWM